MYQGPETGCGFCLQFLSRFLTKIKQIVRIFFFRESKYLNLVNIITIIMQY